MANAPTIPDWLPALPKVELHCHLDGSLRPATIWEWAQAEGVELPVAGVDDVRRFFTAEKRSLNAYLELFQYSLKLLQRGDHLTRAVVELIEDSSNENGIYIEVRFAPMLHTEQGLSPEAVVEAALAGLHEGCAQTGTYGGLILCGMKQESPDQTLEVARLAEAYQDDGVVAFDLAGPERDFPLTLHEQAIRHAKEAGLSVTLHAGEDACPEHIEQALQLGTDRIGHGLHLNDAPAHVRERIVTEGVPLEMCPTSNLQTARFASYGKHPIMDYARSGVRVTVNTDNRLMSNTTLTHELAHLISAFSLSQADVTEVLENAARAAFTPDILTPWRNACPSSSG